MAGRPTVSIVVPLLGDAGALARVIERFAPVLGAGDELIVVENGPVALEAPDAAPAAVRVLWHGSVASSYAARNAGAAAADGEWLLFCDGDVSPGTPLLLDEFFSPTPSAQTGVIAGGVRDASSGSSLAARLARETAAMNSEGTLSHAFRPYALTACAAVRAAAFSALGGFTEVVSGGDADLCWRLAEAGWTLESRPKATVDHDNRSTLRSLWRQRSRHGAGAAWLDQRWPGSMPRWGASRMARASASKMLEGVRTREVGLAAAQVSTWWAFALGRRRSNMPPAPR